MVHAPSSLACTNPLAVIQSMTFGGEKLTRAFVSCATI